MLSQTSEYTLRVVVFLGRLDGQAATARQIAAATRVPEGYLVKILQILSRAGFVRSQRGLHGGSVLARDPATISVYDVIQAVAPLPRIRNCPLGLESHGAHLCPLHRRLDNAMEMVENAFRHSTIADILEEGGEDVELSQLPGDRKAAVRAAEAVFPVKSRAASREKKPRGRRGH